MHRRSNEHTCAHTHTLYTQTTYTHISTTTRNHGSTRRRLWQAAANNLLGIYRPTGHSRSTTTMLAEKRADDTRVRAGQHSCPVGPCSRPSSWRETRQARYETFARELHKQKWEAIIGTMDPSTQYNRATHMRNQKNCCIQRMLFRTHKLASPLQLRPPSIESTRNTYTTNSKMLRQIRVHV